MNKDLSLAIAIKVDGNKAAADMRRFTESTSKGLSQLSRQTKQLWRDFNGFSASVKLFTAAGGLLASRQLLGGMIDLEKAMLGVKSNLIGGAKSAADLQSQLKDVRDTARQISGMTIFSDAEMVVLTNQLLKSGVKADFVNGSDGAAMSTAGLAQLGGLAPEQAAGYMGALGNAFSFNSKEQYTGLADHIVKADDASAMNSGNIMYNMQQTSATGAALKIDPKRIVSLIAYLDALGNEAGTSVNRLLGNLAAPTPEKRKALADSGMEFWKKGKDGKVVLKDVGEVMDIIRKKFAGMKNEQEKIALGNKLFGEEGERAALLLSSKDQSFAEFEKSVEGSTGANDKLKIQMQGLGAAVDRLKNTTFAKLDTQFAPVRDGATTGVNALTRYIDKGKLPDMVGAVAGLGGMALLARFNKNRKGRLATEAADKADSLERAAAAAKTQNVFITNWPKSMLSPGEQVRGKIKGDGSAPDVGGDQPKKRGKLAMAGNVLGAVGGLSAAWETGQAVGNVIKDVIDTTLQASTKNENASLGTWLYDKVNQPSPKPMDKTNGQPAFKAAESFPKAAIGQLAQDYWNVAPEKQTDLRSLDNKPAVNQPLSKLKDKANEQPKIGVGGYGPDSLRSSLMASDMQSDNKPAVNQPLSKLKDKANELPKIGVGGYGPDSLRSSLMGNDMQAQIDAAIAKSFPKAAGKQQQPATMANSEDGQQATIAAIAQSLNQVLNNFVNKPIKIDVDVKNGNIVAEVNKASTQQARRN